jgi:hypothetical protein
MLAYWRENPDDVRTSPKIRLASSRIISHFIPLRLVNFRAGETRVASGVLGRCVNVIRYSGRTRWPSFAAPFWRQTWTSLRRYVLEILSALGVSTVSGLLPLGWLPALPCSVLLSRWWLSSAASMRSANRFLSWPARPDSPRIDSPALPWACASNWSIQVIEKHLWSFVLYCHDRFGHRMLCPYRLMTSTHGNLTGSVHTARVIFARFLYPAI